MSVYIFFLELYKINLMNLILQKKKKKKRLMNFLLYEKNKIYYKSC